ncbi:uncharacterized protein LOC142349693 isoform X2 [Convolutriloba macropyga]|uniref:uncharacterized protein LOC142349693 isoform X2 n=1 Tax=Convolutriloba macropyga TaxID=536237 RepID=UPI003F51CD7E
MAYDPTRWEYEAYFAPQLQLGHTSLPIHYNAHFNRGPWSSHLQTGIYNRSNLDSQDYSSSSSRLQNYHASVPFAFVPPGSSNYLPNSSNEIRQKERYAGSQFVTTKSALSMAPLGKIVPNKFRRNVLPGLMDFKGNPMKVNAPVTMRVDGVFRTAPLCDTNNVRRLEDEKRSRILNLMSKRRDVFPVNALNQWSTKPATSSHYGLAVQAAYAKFIQIVFGEEEIAKELLLKYMRTAPNERLYCDPHPCRTLNGITKEAVILPAVSAGATFTQFDCSPWKNRKKVQACRRSPRLAEKRLNSQKSMDTIPVRFGDDNKATILNQSSNWKHLAEILREKQSLIRTLGSLKSELTMSSLSKLKSWKMLYRNEQKRVNNSMLDENALKSLKSLNSNSFVDSLSIENLYFPVQKFSAKLLVNDRYHFMGMSDISYNSALEGAIKQAMIFMSKVEKAASEKFIPSGMLENRELLTCLIELQTGAPLLSFYVKFDQFDRNYNVCGGTLAVDGQSVECRNNVRLFAKTSLLNELLKNFLVEKLGFEIV